MMKRSFRVSVVACAGLALGAIAVFAQQDVYLDKCATCHGPDGSGKTAKGKKLKVKDVRETAAKLSAEDMIKIVENGKGADMDAYGKQLSKQQIQAVVDYYRALAKK